MDEQTQIKDIKGIIRRGRKSFISTALCVFILGIILAFSWDDSFKSQSTILIENQMIPQEFVLSTITGYVEERLEMITQRIMSRSKLVSIIDEFDLYPDMRDNYTTEEIVEKMSEDIKLETISAEVIDQRTGRPTAATIAFTLAYIGDDPRKVNKVANKLASLYLEENLKTREEQATDTTNFLQQERDEIKGQISDLEDKLRDFKELHAGALPEHTPINMQAVTRLESEINQASMQIRSLQERLIYLQGQIMDVDPLNPIMTEDGKAIMHPAERLKYLRLELITAQARLSEKHPDIKNLKRQIEELEAQVGASDDAVDKIRRLKDLQGQLAALKGKLGAKHPDVVKLSKEVDLLTKEVDDLQTEMAANDVSEEKPDNPTYINLKTQIASTEMDLQTSIKTREALNEKIAEYLAKIEKTPQVEKEYNDLIRDFDNARAKFSEVNNKLMEARISQGMEESQRGERFTIIDPAQLPEKPFKPNRIAIILISFVLAMGAGVGLAAVQESMDTSVKSPDQLAGLSGLPVFSTISKIETQEEKSARKRKTIIWIGAGVGVLVLAIVLIHLFYMPLDIAWIKVQRRLMIL